MAIVNILGHSFICSHSEHFSGKPFIFIIILLCSAKKNNRNDISALNNENWLNRMIKKPYNGIAKYDFFPRDLTGDTCN